MRKKSLTKLEADRLRKKLAAEEEEKIEVLGQESTKKSKKWIIEEAEKSKSEEKKKEEQKLEKLDDVKKSVLTYRQHLMFYLHDLVLEIKLPKEYFWGVWYDGKGIRLTIRDKYKKLHQRAFKICYDPKYDLNKIYEFAVWAEDVYDSVERTPQKSIWTPKTN